MFFSGPTAETAILSKYLCECDLWPRALGWPQMEIRVSVSQSPHQTPSVCSQNQSHEPSPMIMSLTWTPLRLGKNSHCIIHILYHWHNCGKICLRGQTDLSVWDVAGMTDRCVIFICHFPTGLCILQCGQEHCWVLHEWIQWYYFCLVSDLNVIYTQYEIKNVLWHNHAAFCFTCSTYSVP